MQTAFYLAIFVFKDSSLSDDMDISSKGSLFGGLAQPKPIALNDKLELPDFPESGSVDFKTYLHEFTNKK